MSGRRTLRLSNQTITIIAVSLGLTAALLGIVAFLIVLYQRRELRLRRQSLRSRTTQQRRGSVQTFQSLARTPVVHQYTGSTTPSTRSLISDFRRSRGQYTQAVTARQRKEPICDATSRPVLTRQASRERPAHWDVPIIRAPSIPKRVRPPPALTTLPARSAYNRPSTTLHRPQSGSTTTSAFAIISAAPSPAGLDRSNTMPWKSPRYPPIPRGSRPHSPPSDMPPLGLGGDSASISSFGLSYLMTPHTQVGRSIAALHSSPGARIDSPSVVASSVLTRQREKFIGLPARSVSPFSQKTLASFFTGRITDGGTAPLKPARPDSLLMPETEADPFADGAPAASVAKANEPLQLLDNRGDLSRTPSFASTTSSRTARPNPQIESMRHEPLEPGLVIEMEPGTPRTTLNPSRRSSLSWIKFAEKFHAQQQGQEVVQPSETQV